LNYGVLIVCTPDTISNEELHRRAEATTAREIIIKNRPCLTYDFYNSIDVATCRRTQRWTTKKNLEKDVEMEREKLGMNSWARTRTVAE
jgi:hypothetical protein